MYVLEYSHVKYFKTILGMKIATCIIILLTIIIMYFHALISYILVSILNSINMLLSVPCVIIQWSLPIKDTLGPANLSAVEVKRRLSILQR